MIVLIIIVSTKVNRVRVMVRVIGLVRFLFISPMIIINVNIILLYGNLCQPIITVYCGTHEPFYTQPAESHEEEHHHIHKVILM